MIVRFAVNGASAYGLAVDGVVHALRDPFGAEAAPGAAVGDLAELTLLAPCEPRNVICANANVPEWHDGPLPTEPNLFLKSPACVIGPGADVVRPTGVGAVGPEGEIAVVIGRSARNIDAEEASEYIAGYTCANEVSALDRKNLFSGKSYETFLPLGPGIVKLEGHIAFSCSVDDKLVQSTSTESLIFGLAELVAAASRAFTLRPGDVILSGCPPRVDPVSLNAVMSVHVEGVGTLSNRLVAAPA